MLSYEVKDIINLRTISKKSGEMLIKNLRKIIPKNKGIIRSF